MKSYLQQYDVDFDPTFATMIELKAFQILFAFTTFNNLDINQMDVKTTFLYKSIHQLLVKVG